MTTLTITAEVIREFLEYIPEAGTLLQKKARPKVKVGAIAGVVTPYGYRYIQLSGKKYAAHRLVWLIETGAMPEGELDHIDGNKLNNKFSNLRVVTRKQNCENKGAQRNNQLGLRGVSYNTRLKKYVAQIQHHGKNKYLGVFSDPQAARAAYILAERELFTHFQKQT
jgi:hypothetical protein